MNHDLQSPIPIDGMDPLDPLHNADLWQTSPSFETINSMMSPTTSHASSVHTPTHLATTLSSSNSEVSYNNVLSENAIESIRRQQDQNKLIHLDPIPDFKDKSEVKPWLQKIFYPQGIEIVIERSDNMKIVFKCKAAKRVKGSKSTSSLSKSTLLANNSGANLPSSSGTCDNADGYSPNSNSNSNSNSASNSASQRKKRAVSPYNTCPFRVRATYSLKRKKWNIVVVNNAHSHSLTFDPDSEDYKKFKNTLKENGDLSAVKKFDELEYRTKFNLPIDLSPIPCDCGLTQEIQSFNIVLPSNNVMIPSSRTNSLDANTVSKPKKSISKNKCKTPKQLTRRTTKSKLQRDIESNSTHTSRTTTPLSNVQNSLNLQFAASLSATFDPSALTSNVIMTPQDPLYHDLIPTSNQSQPNESPNYSNLNLNYFNVQNEIDFNEFFSKPLPHFKNIHTNVVNTQGTIPISFHNKNQHSPEHYQSPNGHMQQQHHQKQKQHQYSNSIYHNSLPTTSTNPSPSVTVNSSRTPGTTNSNTSNGVSSVPLYSSNLSKEPIQDFVDMNQIFGTTSSNANSNSILSGDSLNFQHSNIPTLHSTVSAVCEINNYDICENDHPQCDQVYQNQMKTEGNQHPDYISSVLNSDFSDMKLTQSMALKEEGNGSLSLPSSDHINYHIQFNDETRNLQQRHHQQGVQPTQNPQNLWDEPHGYFQ